MRDRAKREADAIITEARNEAREVARSARAEQERLLAETRKIEAMLRGALAVIGEAGEPVAAHAGCVARGSRPRSRAGLPSRLGRRFARWPCRWSPGPEA